MTPEEYFTESELEYLRDRLSDAKQSLRAHEKGIVIFPKGEHAQLATMENVLEIALKLT